MMARALELAARGIGHVSPGPLVGTVIVDPHGEIAGEGFYVFDQVKHAETIALDQAGARATAATVTFRWNLTRITAAPRRVPTR